MVSSDTDTTFKPAMIFSSVMGSVGGRHSVSAFFLRALDCLRERRRHVLPRVGGLERDPSLELPRMLGAIDAGVVHARADDEAEHAAAVVEQAAVARVH